MRVGMALACLCVQYATESRAQGCCSAGGAAAQIGLFRQDQLSPGQATFAVYYRHTQADRSFAGNEPTDDPQARQASLRAFTGTLSLGLPLRLTAFAAIPAAWRERSELTSYAGQAVEVAYDGQGVADPIVALSRQLAPENGAGGWRASLGAGLQIPLGEDEVRKDGVRLPTDVQPATGDWGVMLLQSLSRSAGDWNFFENATWAFTWANTVGYELGNALRIDVGTSVVWKGPLEPFARLDLLFAEPDRSLGRTLPSTGGTRFYVAPGVAINLKPQRLLWSAEVGLPVYQNYIGNQLGTGVTWLLGLSYQL